MTDAASTGPTEAEEKEMSFLEHLEELRWRIIKALAGIIIGTIISAIFIDWIMNKVLLQPVISLNSHLSPGQQPLHLQNLKPFGQLFLPEADIDRSVRNIDLDRIPALNECNSASRGRFRRNMADGEP